MDEKGEKGREVETLVQSHCAPCCCTWIVDQVMEVGLDKGGGLVCGLVQWFDGPPVSAGVSNNKKNNQTGLLKRDDG